MSFLITFRGLATLLLAAYLLVGPGAGQSDIIAGVFGLTLLIAAIICIALFTYNFNKVRKSLTLSLRPEQNRELHAAENIRIFFKISKLYLLPLFELNIKTVFRDSTEIFQPIFINRNLAADTEEILNWKFPHRGIWQVEKFVVTFRDRLGFFELKRNFSNSCGATIDILPARQRLNSLPLIVSAYAPGDSLPIPDKPQGDYYELKKHQPADGSKKIVWKIFARTGELITRHPEETVSPEGKTVIFLLADKQGDDAAFAALEYAKKLEQEKIEILASCSGNQSGLPASNANQFSQQILESVWRANSNPLINLKQLTEEAQRKFQLENLVIFCQSRISPDLTAKYLEVLKFAGSFNCTCISCKPALKKLPSASLAGRLFKTQSNSLSQENIHRLIKQAGIKAIEC